jgi:aminomethyltransferase
MPVQYTSIIDEHTAVRTAAGIFDISHMGEVMVKGGRSADFLNHLLTNDVRKLAVGQGQYTLMCNEGGGAVDDLYAYRLGEADYLLIVNASRIPDDMDWIRAAHAKFPQRQDVSIENVSDQTGAVAVQGPAVAAFIEKVFTPVQEGTPAAGLAKNQIGRFASGNIEAWVSRTGYTGEYGFEVVAGSGDIAELWNKLIEAGRPHGLKPAGLGARDTLRTEACYPLYGHELDDQTGPIEAGLGFFVSFDKGDFIGRTALLDKKAKGASKKLMAFKTVEQSAPPRPGYTLWSAPTGGEQIGSVASGTLSPSLGSGIGLAYLKPEAARVDAIYQLETRGRRSPVVLCKKPLYRKPVDQPS